MKTATLALLALGATTATELKHNNANALRPALKLRGGVGPVEPAMAATVGCSLFALNGVYCGLAPAPAAAAYGVGQTSFNLEQMIKNLGYTFIGFAILALGVLKGVSFNKAFGWSNLPWVLLTLENIWNGVTDKMGIPVAGQYLLLAINSFGLYAGLTDTLMPAAAVGISAWTALNGAFFALNPGAGASAWGLKDADEKFLVMMKNFGYALFGYATLTYLLATGMDVSSAVGYAFIPNALSIIDGLFVSKGFLKMGSPPEPGYVWLAIMGAVIASTVV
jgi:hypothetical protein